MVISVLNHLSYNIFVKNAVKKFVKTIKMLCPWIQVSFKLQLNESRRRRLQAVSKPLRLIDMFTHNKSFW